MWVMCDDKQQQVFFITNKNNMEQNIPNPYAQHPNNTSYKNNYHINIQTPPKNTTTAQDNHMGSTFVKTPNHHMYSGTSHQIKEESPDKQTQLELVQVPYAYGWNCINYRQSKYSGRILYTRHVRVDPVTHKQPDIQSLPHINRTKMNSTGHGFQELSQYKHGPGILVLDNNIWVIARWNYDRICGNRLYVIGVDLGLLELRIDNPITGQQKTARAGAINYDLQVQEICCIGTSLKNTSQNNKYVILGSQSQGTWKWVANLSATANLTQNNSYYYLQTQQSWSAKKRYNQLVNKIIGWKQITQVQGKNGFNLQGIQKFSSYSYAISNICSILIDKQSNMGNQEGFKLQEQVTNVTTHHQIPLFSNGSRPHKVYNTQTLIYSDFNIGQTIHIRMKSQSATQQSEGNQKQAWTSFDITELAVYRKDVKSKEQMPTGTIEYLYRVKQIQQQVSKDGTLLLPKIQIEQRISDKIEQRYRYSCSYNIYHSLNQPLQLYTTTSPEYALVQKEKSKLHLRSLNFISRSHTKLMENINNILLNVQTAYFHLKQLHQKNSINAPQLIDQSQSQGQITRPVINKTPERFKNRHISPEQKEVKFERYFPQSQANLNDLKKQLERIHLNAKYSKLKKQTDKIHANDKKLNKTFTPTYKKIYHNLSHYQLPISKSHKKLDKLRESMHAEKNQNKINDKTNPEKLNSSMLQKYQKNNGNNSMNCVVKQQPPQQEQGRQHANSQLVNLTRLYGSIHKQLIDQSIKNKIPLDFKEDKLAKNPSKINPKDKEKSYYDRMVKNYANMKKQKITSQQHNGFDKKSYPSGTYKKYI